MALRSSVTLGPILLTILAWPVLAGASSGTLRGLVLGENGPLSYANVIVLGTKIGAPTDSAGRFLIRDVPTGLQSVQVHVIGYLKLVVRIEVREGDNPPLRVTLEPKLPQSPPPRCDPHFAVEPFQGDRAVPKGAVVLDYVGEVDRARSSDSTAVLQIESVEDPCVLEISWEIRASLPSACITVTSATGDTVSSFEGGRRGKVRWDGADRQARSCRPGVFRVRLASTGVSCELRCERVATQRVSEPSPSLDRR
jgi:hypothetical protein